MESPKQPNPQPKLEAPAATVTPLTVPATPKKKPAGKPQVKTNKVKPEAKKKVTTPGLGKVSLVSH